jgi:hypothetical protein
MFKSIPFFLFARLLFDSNNLARKGAIVLKAILEAQSPRLSEIVQKMPGTPVANYKFLQRFLARRIRNPLYSACFKPAPFVLGDQNEMPRAQAWKTSYFSGFIVRYHPGVIETLADPHADKVF